MELQKTWLCNVHMPIEFWKTAVINWKRKESCGTAVWLNIYPNKIKIYYVHINIQTQSQKGCTRNIIGTYAQIIKVNYP